MENHLTARGTEVTDETVSRADAALRPALEEFGQDSLDAFLRLAARLIEVLDPVTGDGPRPLNRLWIEDGPA